MPKKIQPRWGWYPTHNSDDESERQARIDLDRMASILGIRDEETRAELWKDFVCALGGYYFDTYDIPYPSRAEMQSALIELRNRADALSYAMKALDHRSWQWVAPRIDRLAEPGQIEPLEDEPDDEFYFGPQALDIKWKKTIAFLELINRAADETAAGINPPPPKRVRRGNASFLEAIQHLAGVYETHTERDAYSSFYYDAESREYGGPFFILVSEVFEAYEPEVRRSNNSIGEAIRRAIGDRTKFNGKIEP